MKDERACRFMMFVFIKDFNLDNHNTCRSQFSQRTTIDRG